MTANKLVAWLTGILTLLLALFSFVLSFNALTDLAAAHGVSIPILFPLTVEAGVIIFSLNALYRSLHGEPAKVQWLLIIGSSLLAGVFNILHAQADIVSRIMAAMPSLFLLLSFETFLGQVKHAVKRSSTVNSIAELGTKLEVEQHRVNTRLERMLNTLHSQFDSERQKLLSQIEQLKKETNTHQVELNTLTDRIEQSRLTLNKLTSDIKQAKQIVVEQSNSDKQNRLTQLVDVLRVNPSPVITELADGFNVSRNTIYSDINSLVEQGVISKNGDGWQVTK